MVPICFVIISSVNCIIIMKFKKYFMSNTIFTINLIVEVFAYLYLAKYFDYHGYHTVALILQVLLFYFSHYMIKCILECFNIDTNEYVNYSMPEIGAEALTNYIMSLRKIDSDQ